MEKETHTEKLSEVGLPDFQPGKLAGDFTDQEIENYEILHGSESFVQRLRLDRKIKQLSELDREIEEKQKQNGQGPVSRSEFDELNEQVMKGKVPPSRLDDLLARATEYGWKDDEQ